MEDYKPRMQLSMRLIEEIVRDKNDLKMSVAQIVKKHRVCTTTVRRVLKRYPYGFWDKENEKPKIIAEPKVTLNIYESPAVEKPGDVSDVAKNVVYLTLKEMEAKLLSEDKKNLSPSQLAGFMSAAAPYVMSKPDPDSKDKEKDKDINRIMNELKGYGSKESNIHRN